MHCRPRDCSPAAAAPVALAGALSHCARIDGGLPVERRIQARARSGICFRRGLRRIIVYPIMAVTRSPWRSPANPRALVACRPRLGLMTPIHALIKLSRPSEASQHMGSIKDFIDCRAGTARPSSSPEHAARLDPCVRPCSQNKEASASRTGSRGSKPI